MSDSIKSPVRMAWQRFANWLLFSQVHQVAQARQARLMAVVLVAGELLTVLILAIGAISRMRTASPDLTAYLQRGGVVAALLLVLYFVNRRGLTRLAGVGTAMLLLGVAFALVAASGPLTPNAVGLIVPVIVAGLFGPPAAAAVIAIIAAAGYLALNLQANPDYIDSLRRGENVLETVLVYLNLAFVAVVSWLFSRMTQGALRETQELGLALVTQRRDLEQRLALQTRQLQATTTVARAVAGRRDMDSLLEDAVRLVRETFGYYHVQVFLVDEDRDYAVLRQSTGEVGQQLLERGHRLPVGSLSVIGQVAASGRPVIASDTDADVVHRRNELLPHTRSEIAIPLTVGDQVIGALDMQSVELNAFDEEMLPTFQALADQLAIAIENARLFEQAEQNLREFRDLSRLTTERSWGEFLAEAREEERRQAYGPEPKALSVHRSRVIERVVGAGSLLVSSGKDGRQAFIAAPIVVRNEVIGVVGVEPDGVREWTQDDLQLLQSIAERAALAVENARLYIQAQRAADRERVIGEIASRMQRAPSLAMLLDSVTKELAEVLGTENVYAEISLDSPLAHSPKAVSRSDDSNETGDASDTPEEARAEL